MGYQEVAMNTIVAQSILSQIDHEAVQQRKNLLAMRNLDWSADIREAHERAMVQSYTAGLLRAMQIVADQAGIRLHL